MQDEDGRLFEALPSFVIAIDSRLPPDGGPA